MRTFLRKLRARKSRYLRLIEIAVDRTAILHNLHEFQRECGIAVAPVLKSNAYGHGLVEVAGTVDGGDIPFLCVDSFFEALILRNENIKTPILIIGYTLLENIKTCKLADVAFAVLSFRELQRLAESKLSAAIHLKIDTGMHRHGILPGELDQAVNILKENPQIILEGIYSHLADADTANSPHTESQIAEWNRAAARMKGLFPGIKYFHCGQTAGSAYSHRIEANAIRLGIGLYGINSGLEKLDLCPALEMRTRITSLRNLQPGEFIGYGATFKVQKEMWVAAIPAGYMEGIDRRLSNKGSLAVKGIQCPIVGRVSMNITSLDVSEAPDIDLDDEVVVISKDAASPNSIENMARICDTIPYELMVHLPAGLHRIVV